MNRIALWVIVSIGIAMAPASVTAQSELGGMYLSQGSNPDGSEYHGLVSIEQHGESFVVSWIFPRLSNQALVFVPTAVGVGIRSGEVLAVSYYGPEMAGVVVYRVGEDGQLTGRWVLAGDETVHSETLTRLPGESSDPAAAPPDPPEQEEPSRSKDAPPPAGAVSL